MCPIGHLRCSGVRVHPCSGGAKRYSGRGQTCWASRKHGREDIYREAVWPGVSDLAGVGTPPEPGWKKQVYMVVMLPRGSSAQAE